MRDELRTQLEALEANIEAAKKARIDWLAEHEADFAVWPIGTGLYRTRTGEFLGTIVKYMRPPDRPQVEYVCRDASGRERATRWFSDDSEIYFCTRDELIKRRREELEDLGAERSE